MLCCHGIGGRPRHHTSNLTASNLKLPCGLHRMLSPQDDNDRRARRKLLIALWRLATTGVVPEGLACHPVGAGALTANSRHAPRSRFPPLAHQLPIQTVSYRARALLTNKAVSCLRGAAIQARSIGRGAFITPSAQRRISARGSRRKSSESSSKDAATVLAGCLFVQDR